jgi:hypothetical protein
MRIEILNKRDYFDQYWVGSDYPVAFTAFIDGMEACVQELADRLADSPQTYEEAKSEEQWREHLTNLLNKNYDS